MTLPDFFDEFDAIEYYSDDLSDAHKAFTVAFLSNNYSNKQIRYSLNIKNNYTVSHLKSVGLKLTENELELWHQNSDKISLGHVRALVKYDAARRDSILRNILVKGHSVRYVESLEKQTQKKDPNVEKYERDMGDQLGCKIDIKYDPNKKIGSLTLPFYSYEDLENIAIKLGYKTDEFN
jgi:ParB family chromosome partitioning protein